MTLVLGERPLEPADVCAVARGGRVTLGDSARERMDASRAVIERLLERNVRVYGMTTGVGALKEVRIAPDAQAAFQVQLLRGHRAGHGELAPPEFVRAAMVVRAAGLAVGVCGVRPAVAEAFCRALDAAEPPRVHLLGSIGQADLSQMAEIGVALIGRGPDGERLAAAGFEPVTLGPREAHAIVNSNAFSVGIACLALERARRALHALDLGAATSFEALLCNVDALHPAVGTVRAHRGAVETLLRLRALLSGGTLISGAQPPNALQDPLAFKVVPQTHGAARHALAECDEQLRVELASSGDSPLVLVDEERAISNGNHDIAPVAIALDYARLGLAQAVTIGGERVQKLLTTRHSGLPTSLRQDAALPEDGLGIRGNGAASLAGEARLLAQPVTLEQPTSAIAEGIEDRITMAPTAARRLHEMAGLALRLAAVELECAAQAVDLRGNAGALGAGTARAYEEVRRNVPFVAAGTAPDGDLGALTRWLAIGDPP
jgi:histidine ammonia-lyase